MALTDILRKVAVAISKGESDTDRPIAEVKAFLASFDAPKTDMERSFCQYKCQVFFSRKLITFLSNLAALPLIVWYLLPRKPLAPADKQVEAVFIRDDKPENIMPDCLREELSSLEVDPQEGFLLLKEDRKFIGRIFWKHPFSWMFLLKSILKIGRYRSFIQQYHPKKLIVCNEYSFTSSLLTQYCEENGIELINVMHGEKLFLIENSFFRFHRCYVWDAHYVKLFQSMRAEPNQFIVAIPPSLLFSEKKPDVPEYDYTYYFQAESKEELQKIWTVLEYLRKKGARISLRPHPRYSDMETIRSMFQGMNIEDYRQVTIEQSVLRTRYAISGYSTVLQQAYYNGVSVVIDDYSCPERFTQLKDYSYIMLSKEYKLLSSLLGE